MPELPEVETVVRDLRPELVGRTFTALNVGPQTLRKPWQKTDTPKIIGSTIQHVLRRGKWIGITLSIPEVLLVHLGMTGQFTIANANATVPNHTHFVFTLSDARELRFRDVRRFGSISLLNNEAALHAFLNVQLGPEPADLILKDFQDAIRASGRTVKAILLDQTVVAGIGNIYADEALFRAGLHPERRGTKVKLAECEQLMRAIQEVIAEAIERRGSTIRDYIGGSGLRGGFQHALMVYGRTSEACVRCGTPIRMVRVGGRSSHFCPQCQKPG